MDKGGKHRNVRGKEERQGDESATKWVINDWMGSQTDVE